MKKLSEMKISERIRAVKHDVELCIKDADVEFDMGEWVATDYENNTCSVCVAGAYMYKSMGAKNLTGILHYSEEE